MPVGRFFGRYLHEGFNPKREAVGHAQAVEIFGADLLSHKSRRLHEVNAVKALAETATTIRLNLPGGEIDNVLLQPFREQVQIKVRTAAPTREDEVRFCAKRGRAAVLKQERFINVPFESGKVAPANVEAI